MTLQTTAKTSGTNGSPSHPVIAIVGAGSLNWGCHIVVDILLNPDLEGAEIRLIDVLPERLAMVHEWCEFACRSLNGSQMFYRLESLFFGFLFA